ncbi:MAG: tRNA lysidine(34) synthetase TilS [Sedimentibacter saalensis]|uniref:tRNA lysidine(34) synthetase TilS n=1 Tax=Sedimentibacter saalensis TaxID=130788 RepID=UPI002B1ECA38|nr:tRNA lysidine(34) synthetase TilS [Sedimentibacter saalensis]MEA5093582.1 tRNA lysidine(34) synthetase TilS [Sedimentibacter saalensis]
MYNLIKENIIQKQLIKAGDNVLIGLSGGPDSVFLFHNLRKLKESLSFNLYASHINHMYRGKDAQHDEDFVRSLCEDYGVRLFVKRKNATDYAKELKVTEEEAGRILRYNFFRENLSEVGGGIIAVAHNLNDQAETVLQRILRGTGIDGLCAMSFVKDDLIRPMLNVQRSEIEKYLRENNFEFCIDITNTQAIYGRNKIRLNLIPYLEENFNPNIQNSLYRLSETMERDKKIIDKYVEIKFCEALVHADKNKIVLNLQKLKDMDEGEAGRVIRKSIEQLKGNTVNVEMKHIDYAIDFIKTGSTGKKINLSEGFTIEISYDNFIVNKIVENIPEFKYTIELDKPLFIKETGKTVLCSVKDISEVDIRESQSINLDFDHIKGNLTVRNRRTGDTIVPCGNTWNKKIKDIFIDLKIPAEERDSKLIIADDENILWLEDFRIHNSYKVSSSTKKILNITIGRSTNE